MRPPGFAPGVQATARVAPTADLVAAALFSWLLSAFGRFTFSPSPTVLKKTFRNWVGEALGPPARIRTGSVGSANSGAVRKPQQNQILPTQAPSGAGRKRRQSLLILRAGIMAAQTRRASPVKRGPGKGEYERVSAHLSRPWERFAFFFAMEKEGHRPQAAKLPHT